jgi:hypothetical protein
MQRDRYADVLEIRDRWHCAADRFRRRCLVCLVLLAAIPLTLLVGTVLAQVPPHSPGTICFTQRFWCWAQPPGPPGSPCICPSPNGPVNGVRG